MEAQRPITTADERYMAYLIQGLTAIQIYDIEHENRDKEEDIPNSNPYVDKKLDRQKRYRKRREISLSRDNPPRLPCRPYFDNGDEYMSVDPDEEPRTYHQPRVDQSLIPPRGGVLAIDKCYTCTNHRYCVGPVCEARVVSCYYCNSQKGPLRVRWNRKQRAT